ncbi:MAG: class I SAM-dependent methyltransferase [Rhodomicrobium sp.]
MKGSFLRPAPPKPDYGIDAAPAVRRLLLAGFCAIAAGTAIPPFHAGGFKISLAGPTLLALGSLSLILCISMLAWSLRGKFNIRNRILSMIQWRGSETVLDIGTGRGLLAIGAAKRLRTGTVTAIDIWDAPAAGNALEIAQRNIEIEGMQDRVELRSGDARDIGFVDNSFDAVLCLLGLHCLEEAARDAACREIARVLKPRGIAIVADTSHAESYARVFREAGLAVQEPKFYTREAFISLAVVIARKR